MEKHPKSHNELKYIFEFTGNKKELSNALKDICVKKIAREYNLVHT